MVAGYEQDIPYDQPAVWMVLSGKATIQLKNSKTATMNIDVTAGQTLLIPANMNEAHLVLHEDTVWLEVTFPQAMSEQIA